MDYEARQSLQSHIEAAVEKLEELRCELDDAPVFESEEDESWDVNDAACMALVALSAVHSVVVELREAGASIESVPVEDEALVTCVVNAQLIHRDMQADIAHMESVLARVRG